MGLQSGPRGVKAQLLSRFPGAFYRAPWLSLGLHDFNIPKDRCALVKDGTVGVMSLCYIPGLTSFDTYVEQMTMMVKTLMRHCKYVFICVDDLQHVPDAKGEEQARRDEQRRSKAPSCELESDDYSLEELQSVCNVPLVIQNRETRYRLVDELYRRVMHCIDAEISLGMDEEDEPCDAQTMALLDSYLIIDGVDERGANREVGSPRNPQCIGTHKLLVDELNARRKQRPIGEADLKMIDVERLLRQLRPAQQVVVDVVMHETIDTDALPIGILDHAARGVTDTDRMVDAPNSNSTISTISTISTNSNSNSTISTLHSSSPEQDDDRPYSYIIFKERGKNAVAALEAQENERQRAFPTCQREGNGNGNGNAGVLMVDMSLLYRELMKSLLGKQWMEHSASYRQRACQLLMASWVMAGCDYCSPLAHSDVLTEAARQLIRNRRDSQILPSECCEERKCLPEWTRSMRRVLQASGECERRVSLARRDKLDAVDNVKFARVGWTVQYWSVLGKERMSNYVQSWENWEEELVFATDEEMPSTSLDVQSVESTDDHSVHSLSSSISSPEEDANPNPTTRIPHQSSKRPSPSNEDEMMQTARCKKKTMRTILVDDEDDDNLCLL